MVKQKKSKIIIFALCLAVLLEAIALIVLWRKLPKKAPPVVRPPVVMKGKIAIVIDDWGYNPGEAAVLNSLRYPFTMSILPNLAYTRSVAVELHRRGYEIILHLPMEPKESMRLEKDTILVSMDAPTIKQIIDRDLASVPYVRGVSNHMGSKVSEDPKAMTVILQELKKRKLRGSIFLIVLKTPID